MGKFEQYYRPIVICERSLGKGLHEAIAPALSLAQNNNVYMVDIVVPDKVFPLSRQGQGHEYLPDDEVMKVDLVILFHQLKGNVIRFHATLEVEDILSVESTSTKAAFYYEDNPYIRVDESTGKGELYAPASLIMRHFGADNLKGNDTLLYQFRRSLEHMRSTATRDWEQEFVSRAFNAIRVGRDNFLTYIPLVRMYAENSTSHSNLLTAAQQYTQCFYHSFTLTLFEHPQFTLYNGRRGRDVAKKTKGYIEFIQLVYSNGKAKITEVAGAVCVEYLSGSTPIKLFLTNNIGVMVKPGTEKPTIIYDLQTMSLDECVKNAKPFGLADLLTACDLRTKVTVQDLISARTKKK